MNNKPELVVVAKGSVIILAGVIIENMLRLPIGILLARLLGPEHLGLYQITVSTLLVLAGISLLGFRMSLIRFIPVYISSGDPGGLMGLIRMGVFIPLIFSILLGVILFISAPILSVNLYGERDLIPLLRIASLIAPVWVLASVAEGIIQGHQKMNYFVLAKKIFQPSIRLVLVTLFVLTAVLTPLTALYSLGLSVLCVFLLMFYWMVKAGMLSGVNIRYDINSIGKFAIPIYISNLLMFIGPNIKLLLIGLLATSVEVGIYTPVYEIAMMAALVHNSIIVAASPKIAELHYQAGRQQLKEFYIILSKWVLVINLPVFLIIIIWAKPLLMIFGEGFLSGTLALRVLAIAGLINIAIGISPAFISMTGNANLKLINTLLLYLVMLCLDWYAIPLWGITGAAFSFLIAMVVVSIVTVYQVFSLFSFHPFTSEYFKPIIGGCIALVSSWAISKLIFLETLWINTLVCISVFLFVYGVAIIIFGFKREEKEIATHLMLSIRTSLCRK